MLAIRPLQVLVAYGWAIAVGAALMGCRPAEESNLAGHNGSPEPVVDRPAAAVQVAPMDREALLFAVAKAASARAAGRDDGPDQRELQGRPFELAIRFGCEGQAKDLRSATFGWSRQADKDILRLRAMLTITADDPVAAVVGGETAEAIEGFWIPRPWMLRAACPVDLSPATPSPTSDPRNDTSADEDRPALRWAKVGIAQFFTRSDPRTRRRDRRAYEAVATVEPGSSVGQQGFELILSGRLRAAARKPVIECVIESAQVPPNCIISADIDEVRMELPEAGQVLARWSS